MPTTEDEKRAQQQARAQLDSIVEMVKRLEHVQECDGGEECNLSDAEIFAGNEILYKEGMVASGEDREQYHDRDSAQQTIEEDPLSVQVQSGWHNPGEQAEDTDYEILLCTGGPAGRIIGKLDQHGQPETAELEYQDWFMPWIRYGDTSGEEGEALLTYARQFYFGG